MAETAPGLHAPRMRFFSFSLLIGGGAVLGHLYLYLRLVRPLTSNRKARAGIGALFVLATLLLVMRRPIRALHPTIEQVHELVSYAWMALAIGMVIGTFVGDVVRVGLGAARWWNARQANENEADETSEGLDADRSPDGAPVDPARRALVTQALPWAVLSAGGLTAGYGSLRAFTPPEVSELAVRLPRLPRTLEGLSVVQLTDIHVGPFIGRRFIDALVTEANALRPDVMVITGDLVDGDVRTLGHAVAGLANLRARYGTYFVTGNHEYYSGELAWVRFLESIGITVLRNQRVSIGDDGGRFDLVGVDDWSGARRRGGQGYDLDAALTGRDPERAAVLLAHQPTNFEVAAQRGIGLQISGHTHGGQIFPMTLLVGLQYQYTRGLYREGDSHIYVSRGCGFWGPPSRIGSPPELVKLNLIG